ALRRALGDGHGNSRYVINIPGRGYRFVAPVTLERGSPSGAVPMASLHEEGLVALVPQTQGGRLFAIVGPINTGNTAHCPLCLRPHDDDVRLVNLIRSAPFGVL